MAQMKKGTLQSIHVRFWKIFFVIGGLLRVFAHSLAQLIFHFGGRKGTETSLLGLCAARASARSETNPKRHKVTHWQVQNSGGDLSSFSFYRSDGTSSAIALLWFEVVLGNCPGKLHWVRGRCWTHWYNSLYMPAPWCRPKPVFDGCTAAEQLSLVISEFAKGQR